jgi:hypothetical protein
VYKWRLLLEECGPNIVCIKGIHNTVADAISRLEYEPSVNQTPESYFMMKVNKSSKCIQRQNWMAVSKHWSELELDTNKQDDFDLLFANRREEEEIRPLTTKEIAKAQKNNQELKIYYKQNAKTPENDMHFQLIEDTKVLYNDDKLIIPASLQHRAVSWYHQYLKHPGHSHLELKTYNTIRSCLKSCRRYCQINKRHS